MSRKQKAKLAPRRPWYVAAGLILLGFGVVGGAVFAVNRYTITTYFMNARIIGCDPGRTGAEVTYALEDYGHRFPKGSGAGVVGTTALDAREIEVCQRGVGSDQAFLILRPLVEAPWSPRVPLSSDDWREYAGRLFGSEMPE